MSESKIYTKSGDKGLTSLFSGKRVPKFHERIETYGSVDELNSFVGLIRDQNIDGHYKEILLKIQGKLLTIGSALANDEKSGISTELKDEDIHLIEKEIDTISKDLPSLKSFIIPGGNTVISYCHIARTICRRAERNTVRLAGSINVDQLIIKYLNRLSDYFYTLARKIAYDKNIPEIPWKAKE